MVIITRRILLTLTVLGVVLCMSGCATAENMLRYMFSLPGNVFNAVAP